MLSLGKTYDTKSLLAERAPGFASEVVVETRRERYAALPACVGCGWTEFKDVAPDVRHRRHDQREISAMI